MAINPVRTPFKNMSFTPDVPSAALGDNEYNIGQNVETDTRGIKKIYGDQLILQNVPGKVIYVTSNFRVGTTYWFIVACEDGKWYGLNGVGRTELTPQVPEYISNQYTVNTAFTDSWNGNVLFVNDGINPPMYLLPTDQEIRLYDSTYNDQTPTKYIWNYYATTPGWDNLRAAFLRVYSAPNVGAILIAGNLSYSEDGTDYNLPNTVRWSQAFGLNSGPTTWAPTLTNIANELDVPVRGPLIDGFPLNGNFYVCSYWDTVVFSPIAYTTINAPVFGIRLVNAGRGLLNENCWANTDNLVFGIDARDVWVFDGGNFKAIGNQRVKDYLHNNIKPATYDQVFMINNSSKYQIEIYYPDLNSTGLCNQMISYRYDLDIWNPPRQVVNAVSATESPVWTANVPNLAARGVVYTRGNVANVQPLIQKDIGNSFINSGSISSFFRRDNINYGQFYSQNVQVHRVLPQIVGSGNIDVTIGGANSTGQAPTFQPTVSMVIDTDSPWVQIDQNDNRVVTLIVASNTATTTWQMTQASWQVSIIEDDR
jgi:hypothetical protein